MDSALLTVYGVATPLSVLMNHDSVIIVSSLHLNKRFHFSESKLKVKAEIFDGNIDLEPSYTIIQQPFETVGQSMLLEV